MKTALEVGRELQAKRQQLAEIQAKYDTGRVHATLGVPVYDYPDGVERDIDSRLTELSNLNDDYVALSRAEVAAKNMAAIADMNTLERKYIDTGAPAGYGVRGLDPHNGMKTLGQRVVESRQFKMRHDNRGHFVYDAEDLTLDRQIALKTLMVSSGLGPGFIPANPRTDLVIPFPNRPLRVVDLIPIVPTTLGTVYWMQEDQFTNNASMTGEGYTKPESTVNYSQQSQPVRKIAHIMSLTQEIVDDNPGFISLIDNDMTLMLGLKEEQQILSGTGVGQELTGILNASNLQSQAFSTNNADTILKCMTKVGWTGYGNVTAVIMHPSNWETTRLIKGATNQDYVLGSPLIDVAPRLWGVPVVVTNAISQGTALVGDFSMFVEIRRRQGMTVDVSDSHSTYFAENKLAVRAEMREALLIKRGSAFCQATSLT